MAVRLCFRANMSYGIMIIWINVLNKILNKVNYRSTLLLYSTILVDGFQNMITQQSTQQTKKRENGELAVCDRLRQSKGNHLVWFAERNLQNPKQSEVFGVHVYSI